MIVSGNERSAIFLKKEDYDDFVLRFKTSVEKYSDLKTFGQDGACTLDVIV